MGRIKEFYQSLFQTDLVIDQIHPDDMALSNCCGYSFTKPGWPESKTCSKCNKNAKKEDHNVEDTPRD